MFLESMSLTSNLPERCEIVSISWRVVGTIFSPPRGLAEAEAYLDHPILGPRLSECVDVLLAVTGRTAHEIFGSPDDMKLKSSMTLFVHVSPEGSVFEQALDKYFDGQRDGKTLELIRGDR